MGIKEFLGKYFYFSNFYVAPVEYGGILYENSEAAYQSAKCITKEERQQFICLGPGEAKKLGKRISLREDWEQIKEQVMYDVVKAKFDQNEDLKQLLVETGAKHLEEGNTWGDRIWGTVDGVGQNKLGKILMRV